MTDPFDDDPWKDLARDLGVEDATRSAKPAAAAKPEEDPEAEPVGEERPARGFAHRPPEPEPAAEDLPPPDLEAEAYTDAVDLDTDEGEEGDVEGAEGEEGAPGEGQPGTGRKRRRRRRRRKKGGPAEGGAEGAPAADVEPMAEAAAGDEGDAEPEAEGDEEEAEEVGAGVGLAAEEDTGTDVLRDIIATWNVPSWDEIVGGLYRPER